MLQIAEQPQLIPTKSLIAECGRDLQAPLLLVPARKETNDTTVTQRCLLDENHSKNGLIWCGEVVPKTLQELSSCTNDSIS